MGIMENGFRVTLGLYWDIGKLKWKLLCMWGLGFRVSAPSGPCYDVRYNIPECFLCPTTSPSKLVCGRWDVSLVLLGLPCFIGTVFVAMPNNMISGKTAVAFLIRSPSKLLLILVYSQGFPSPPPQVSLNP